jgi:histidine triad (HIT) family protein
MSSIFSKIVKGEIPSYNIAETADCIAFLDVNPLAQGHTLVIPKREVDYLFDLEDEQYLSLLLFSKKVARAIKKAVPCKKVGVAVIGLEVPHAHVHLVPINYVGDINFSSPKLSFPPQELARIASEISDAFKSL